MLKKLLRRTLLIALLAVLAILAAAGWQLSVEARRFLSDDPAVWEPVIADFEAADRESPPPPGQLLFLGSSSIRLWESLASDMAPIPAMGRGFGGARINDVRHYAERLIEPYRPSAIALYIGSNDLSGAFGAGTISADEAWRRYAALLVKVRRLAPEAPIYLIALKPTTRGWERWPVIRAFNGYLEAAAAADAQLRYIDANRRLLDADGEPDDDLLFFDGLHLNARGYVAWGQSIREQIMVDMVMQ